MSVQAIERNYRKNPHTARFLQVFHSGISTDGRDHRAEAPGTRESRCLECEGFHPGGASCAPTGGDLLDLVPEETVADLRSPGQVKIMDSLISQLDRLDAETAIKAADYTRGMTERGLWTPGRHGNASGWIDRMINKVAELRAAAPAPAPMAAVADGRYAVEHEGVLKFFKVKNGNRSGFVFLDVQASDEWHAIRNVTRIREIVALIAKDAEAAMIRYGHELGECGRCGRTLTDEASRAAGIGPICATK